MNIEKIRHALELAANMMQLHPTKWSSSDVEDMMADVMSVTHHASEAIAELDKAQHPGKVLTDEMCREIALEVQEDCAIYMLETKWYNAAIGAMIRCMQRVRDNGYLAPAAGPSDERPWMNEWQRNMCKKPKGALIHMIEEEREENDRLRSFTPSAWLTVEEAHEIALQWVSEEDLEHGYTEQAAARLRARLTAAIEAKQKQ